MTQLWKEYQYQDMILRYETDEKGRMAFVMHPSECSYEVSAAKTASIDPMVQVKLTGDVFQGCFAPGNTLRCAESSYNLHFVDQNEEINGSKHVILTRLTDERGYEALHRVTWIKGDPFVTMNVTYENQSSKKITLEMLSSFSLSDISPYLEGDGGGNLMVHRIQSRWSQEGRVLSQSIEELQLEASWNLDSVRCERYGQIGSMPVNHYFPFGAIEDTKTGVFWGAQLAHPASWQMEFYRKDENMGFSGGLADREFGHWKKNLAPGESFTTPTAIVSTAKTDSLDIFCQRLTKAQDTAAEEGPECEQHLPIIFNEYCTTWGCPSHENICDILDAIKDKGFEYFVIDCGWYKADGVPWDISMGDYIPSNSLFPEGLEKTTQAIQDAGLLPGIWFEIENVGHASEAMHLTEHLLHLDGEVLTTTRRRFWNMQDPWVKEYLRERVIGTLKKYNFGYMKVDYNDTIGIGCDGAESLGEGLRRNMEATMEFFEEIKQEVPGIILENCASGGHRLEPRFMMTTAMASFSDAHECVEIPIIASNLHRVILPRQSQIWAVIRESDDLKRIAYSIANTFLGRMCLSGDVTNLTDAQWDVINRGISFYKQIAPIIKHGTTYHVSPQISRMRHPEGWQGVLRIGENKDAYIVLHTFGGTIGKEVPATITVELPEEYNIKMVYSDTNEPIAINERELIWQPTENWKAVAVAMSVN